MSSPTVRTLREIEAMGWKAGIVERYISAVKRRIDLFGFIDIVALTNGNKTVGIQCTSTPNMSSRVAKIKTECKGQAIDWLWAGNQILVIGWKKYKKPVNRKWWRSKWEWIGKEDFSVN